MKTRSNATGALALGLALGIQTAMAAVSPDSLCAWRTDTLFKSGYESLDQMVPTGFQNCETLDNILVASPGGPIDESVTGGESSVYAVAKTLPGESAKGQYSSSGLPFENFDSENGISYLSPLCPEDGGAHSSQYNVAGSAFPIMANWMVSCGLPPVLDGVDVSGDGVADVVNDAGVLSPDFVWLRDFPLSVGVVGDADSYSASRGSIAGSDWSLDESVGGSYSLTAHRDGLDDSASGTLVLRDPVLERLGSNDFIAGSASFSIPCGEEYVGSLVTNTDDLVPAVTDSYSSSNLPAGASVAGDVFSYTPSCALGSPESVSFGLTPTLSAQGNNQTLDEYLVDLAITGVAQPSTVEVYGLGVLAADEVTNTSRFDYTFDVPSGFINRHVSVRKGRSFIPYDVHVIADRGVVVSIENCIDCYDASENEHFAGIPTYISASDNRLDFLSPDGFGGGDDSEGDFGTLQVKACDDANLTDCKMVYVDWQITDRQAKLAGYSTIGPFEAVTNPLVGTFAQNNEEVVCQDDHRGAIIPWAIYKGQGFEGIDLPDGMGVNSNTGEVVWNIDCITQGPGYQTAGSFVYGNSGSMTVIYDSVTAPTQQSAPSKKSDYR